MTNIQARPSVASPSRLLGRAPRFHSLRRRQSSVFTALALAAWLGAGSFNHAWAQKQTPLLRSEHGAPLKLIVRRSSAIYEEPNPQANSRPASPFEFYYAYQPPPDKRTKARPGETRNGYYYISQSAPKGDPVGWISAEDVVVWPHRQALGFAPRGRRRPSLFYASVADLIEAHSGRVSPLSKAISREPAEAPAPGSRPALLPILEEREVAIQGDPVKVYRVAYLHRADAEPRPAKPSETTLDVAFVMDATGSMQDWIKAALEAVSTLSQEIAAIPELESKVRFALVCYRDSRLDYAPDQPGVKGDYVPPDDFIVRTYCDLDEGADHQVFLKQTEEVFAEGGGQAPERVLDGLKSAVRDLTWRKGSYKHIILIGNASTHVDPVKSGGLRIDEVLREAQPADTDLDPSRAMTIHAIRVPTKDAEDAEVCRRQFRRIAAGVKFPGVFDEQDNLQSFSRDLLNLMRGRLSPIRALARGATREEVIESVRDDRLIGPLLAMLRADNTDSQSGFSTGYIAETDPDGLAQVEPYLLVRREQLQQFDSFLNYFLVAIENAGEPGSRDVGQLVNGLQRNVGLLNVGEMDKSTPTKQVLEWVLDAPVRSPIFDLTPQALATLSDAEFQRWKDQVTFARKMVQTRLDDGRAWVDIGRETRSDRKHSFVRIVDLP